MFRQGSMRSQSMPRVEREAWNYSALLTTPLRPQLARLGVLIAILLITNHGFLHRLGEFGRLHKWPEMALFVTIWGVALIALVVAALQPSVWVRCFWGCVIAIATAAAQSFYLVTGAHLTIYDVLSLWTAQHEAGRAVDFYWSSGAWALVTSLALLLVFVLPPPPMGPELRRKLGNLFWFPIVPVAMMAAVLVIKQGSGSRAMPAQFSPLAIGIVATHQIAANNAVKRSEVSLRVAAGQSPVQNIVLVVDESIRPDFIDWTPGNPYTPQLASHKDRIANFGQAASGANCSAAANAIIRLGATRNDFVSSVKTNPTIWQYAKSAGFRTVYIDGQSPFIKSNKKLANYMTIDETKDIDRHVTYDDVPSSELDLKVIETIREELGGSGPVFIYANKNGAHFPYDAAYPEDHAAFTPTMTTTGNDDLPSRINSYRNAVKWSVDGVLGKMLTEFDLRRTAILYTSDHGQEFGEARITHCASSEPHPTQGLVPMLAMTGDSPLMERFLAAASLNYNRSTHFAITPTILELMGFSRQEVVKLYGPPLFEPQVVKPGFTAQFIFGLFRADVEWTSVDLEKNYLKK